MALELFQSNQTVLVFSTKENRFINHFTVDAYPWYNSNVAISNLSKMGYVTSNERWGWLIARENEFDSVKQYLEKEKAKCKLGNKKFIPKGNKDFEYVKFGQYYLFFGADEVKKDRNTLYKRKDKLFEYVSETVSNPPFWFDKWGIFCMNTPKDCDFTDKKAYHQYMSWFGKGITKNIYIWVKSENILVCAKFDVVLSTAYVFNISDSDADIRLLSIKKTSDFENKMAELCKKYKNKYGSDSVKFWSSYETY
jgi:hypothetical protein